MSNIIPIRPGAPVQEQVKNPKTRGRPKGTVSLRTERRRREAMKADEAPEPPYHPSVVLQPAVKGRYHYPKELLLQACICRNSYGWMLPGLSPSVLGNQRPSKWTAPFVSPLGQLLGQLEAEGHDIAGARLELMALREVVTAYLDAAEKMARVHPLKTGEVLGGETWDIEFDGYRSTP